MLNQSKMVLASVGLFALATGLQAVKVNAATITLHTDAKAINETNVVCDNNGPTCTSTSTSAVNGSSADATASANTSTGELKVRLDATYNTLENLGSGFAQGSSIIEESFTASHIDGVGSVGTVSVLMNYDVNWDLFGSASLPTTNFQFQTGIQKDGSPLTPDWTFNPGSITSNSGSLSGQLSVDFQALHGASFDLSFRLLASLLNGEGFVAADNTATFLILASEGLTLTPNDPNFLNDPAFEVVPLPAALPLLMSALGFFGFLGWRRKRMAAA